MMGAGLNVRSQLADVMNGSSVAPGLNTIQYEGGSNYDNGVTGG